MDDENAEQDKGEEDVIAEEDRDILIHSCICQRSQIQ